MLSPVSLGRVNVTTSGTPVQLSSVPLTCSRIHFSVVSGLTGKVYLGTAGVSHSTLAGVIKEFAPNTAGGAAIDDSYEIACGTDANLLNLQDYWLDVSVSGEGLIVSYWKGC